MRLAATARPLPALSTGKTVIAIAVAALLQIAAAGVALAFVGTDLTPGLLAASAVLPAATALLWLWFYTVQREPGGWTAIGVLRPPRHWFPLAMLAGLLAVAGNSLVVLLTRPFLGSPKQLPMGGEMGLWNGPFLYLVLFAIGAVILAPLLEELIFRSLLFGKLRQCLSFWPAAVVAAIAHAVVHFDPATMPGLTVTFIFFAFLYAWSGSVLVPVVAHGTHNLCVLLAGLLQAG